jgi:gliding motility-associated-like protein
LITVYKIPKAIFNAEPKETTLSDPNVTVSNLSVGGEKYNWHFGDNTTSDLFEPNHSYLEPAYYCIRLEVENNFGCIDSTKDCILIKPNFTIFIPNSFTPNKDGLNEVFIPLTQSVKQYEMTIYNRWGLKVFTTNQLEIGWDGGTEPQDAYNYVIELTNTSGEQKLYSGSVTLYR